MKFFLFLIYIFFSRIESQNESDDYDDDFISACESVQRNIISYADCLGRSCEFIEEKCCFLESINSTTGKVDKECVDICFYDYMREDRKQKMINDIKNGTYWESFSGKYQEILTLNCKHEFLYPYILFIIIILFL